MGTLRGEAGLAHLWNFLLARLVLRWLKDCPFFAFLRFSRFLGFWGQSWEDGRDSLTAGAGVLGCWGAYVAFGGFEGFGLALLLWRAGLWFILWLKRLNANLGISKLK